MKPSRQTRPLPAVAPPIEVHARRGQPLGMPPARFLADYWQKHPLLVRGAFPDWQAPLQPEDLAGLACEELALARIVIEHRARTAAGASRWELRTGPFAESEFARLPPSHWTLLVQDVDKWDEDVAALLGHFRFLPSWRIDDVMVSYAVDGGSVGAHVDQYDVFLVQGLGRRRWEIDVDPATPRDFRPDTELKLLRQFTPSHGWELAPGDLLYLPPGVPHHGVAIGPCMTLSVGTRAPAQAELLADLADHLAEALPEAARYADADLAPAGAQGEIDAAAIARLEAALPWFRLGDSAGHGVDAATLRRWFGSFITRYRSAQFAAPNPRALTDATFAGALARAARVRRNPWSRVAWLREGRAALLFVAGECHPCSLAFARLVAAEREFGLDEVAAATDRAVLRGLIDAGHFALLRRPRAARGP